MQFTLRFIWPWLFLSLKNNTNSLNTELVIISWTWSLFLTRFFSVEVDCLISFILYSTGFIMLLGSVFYVYSVETLIKKKLWMNYWKISSKIYFNQSKWLIYLKNFFCIYLIKNTALVWTHSIHWYFMYSSFH